MTSRLGLVAALAALLGSPALVAPLTHESRPVAPGIAGNRLVVHEWGTFTSVAGESGRAVEWLPQTGPSDLPCFVERVNAGIKGFLSGRVRMETPVIYFYTSHPVSVDVSVRFQEGVITEWFPRPGGTSITPLIAAGALRGELAWKNVQVVPNGSAQFPVERESNHYYVARKTDAAPLHVGREYERFLFYRGVGRRSPSISATVAAGGRIVVSHTRGAALGDLMLFENRDGATSYQSVHTSSALVTFAPQALEANALSPSKALEQALIAHGLYPMEAKAMVESWQGSWFEHGTRLFYIVANEEVDAMLPLQINPQPEDIKRVFVGRVEIATRETLNDVRVALERSDQQALAKYGRFLEPIANRLLSALTKSERVALEQRIQTATATSSWSNPSVCLSAAN